MSENDLIIFMGQSNMAGRGGEEEAPVCPRCAGVEFRAVSDPERLYLLREPFGKNENRAGFIDDGEKKRGGMVSAFAVNYHRLTGRRVIAVSASQGGTGIADWKNILADDAAKRLIDAKAFLSDNGLRCAHIFAAWCQGETDGDNGTSAGEYENGFYEVWRKLKSAGAQACFLITIGHFNHRLYPNGIDGVCGGSGIEIDGRYAAVRERQRLICQSNKDIIEAASFEEHADLMRDAFHYFQPAYNKVGVALAKSMADYSSLNGKE